MFSGKNLIRILINTVIGLVFIIFWMKVVDVNAIFKELSRVDLLTVLPFVLFFALSNFLRSMRLKILLSQFKIPLRNVILLNYLSQIFSYIIPLRAGEISKGVYLSTQYKVPFSKSLIWILLDRFLDFWLVLVLVLVLLGMTVTNLPANLKLTIMILIAPSTLIAFLVIFFPEFAKKTMNFFSKALILNVLKTLFTRFTDFIIDTVSLLKREPKEMASLMVLTFGALLSDGLGWYVFFLAVFGKVSFITIFLGSLLSALTYLIPAAPGYVGSAEASGLAVFSLSLGLDKTLTSVATVLNHGLTLVCILFFGISALYLLKFDTNLVWKKFKKQ
ncbi:flippase-like domain-containing protein [Candidatus Daviesbacteria bacterium]|nr:flippase-like domain-containing protein [Candidatus Daviesbacteria bacterium]